MLLSLQYLRGLAALMIVYVHTVGPLERLSGIALPVYFGDMGVDIFFVPSGFVMCSSTASRNIGAFNFLLNGFIRIAPLYWSITLATGVVALVSPTLLRSTEFDAEHFAASLDFIPWPNPKYPGYWPIVIPGWTLNYEMFFYVIFAATLLLSSALRVWVTVAALTALAGIGFMSRPNGIMGFYTHDIILEFGLGVIIGALYTSRWTIPATLAGAAFMCGVALCCTSLLSGPRSITFGLPSVLIVAGLAFMERERGMRSIPLLRHLGDASYSLYLSHPITLAATAILLLRLHWVAQLSWLVVLGAFLLISIAVGSAVYFLVERPLTNFARSTMHRQERLSGSTA